MATIGMLFLILIAGFSAALALDIVMSGGEVVNAAAFAVVAVVAFGGVLLVTQRGVDRAVADAESGLK